MITTAILLVAMLAIPTHDASGTLDGGATGQA